MKMANKLMGCGETGFLRTYASSITRILPIVPASITDSSILLLSMISKAFWLISTPLESSINSFFVWKGCEFLLATFL